MFKECTTKKINLQACEELVLRCQKIVDDDTKKADDDDIFKPLLDLAQYLVKVNQDKVEKIVESDDDDDTEKKNNNNTRNSESEMMSDAELTENGPSTSTVIEKDSDLSDKDLKALNNIKKLDAFLQVF